MSKIIERNGEDKVLRAALENLRDAIQQAEQFGLVRTESGQVITGAVSSDDGIVLTEN
ncbi:hypothetical protein ACXIUH_08865 [Vibrio parahaemolyticus]|uniref:hypothetical protein n=1 Tax=Vibrio TaxID=662 RepID=UPI001CDC5BAE|nr:MULTISPECIES: hypothetical protein [Vibrio]MCA2497800.1 hypothetical protein [Vibrio alginolyticus]MDW2217487.1 hypothetical protein [Vibrio sp. 2175-1]